MLAKENPQEIPFFPRFVSKIPEIVPVVPSSQTKVPSSLASLNPIQPGTRNVLKHTCCNCCDTLSNMVVSDLTVVCVCVCVCVSFLRSPHIYVVIQCHSSQVGSHFSSTRLYHIKLSSQVNIQLGTKSELWYFWYSRHNSIQRERGKQGEGEGEREGREGERGGGRGEGERDREREMERGEWAEAWIKPPHLYFSLMNAFSAASLMVTRFAPSATQAAWASSKVSVVVTYL